ncbi:carboxypeptidase-like regulatory domain-containing protein [Tenacibaculum aiptasiae]|uniref:Carboxypeptidase-like regulatory domain-containing protein n=1 Tax=Tenacibaculum aiptasiae TaxID=426481 RepID=A0A7J5A6R2_9FLAO|nr:carboxypeptidase-like regulatory domain-containing protein [Tenacibaculum aiptasiae]KAB1153207.1 carboxypeptidase-like regulatory domain-containing protein [Tenacibaculum aiptasiae]
MKKILLLFILLSQFLFCQEERKTLFGIIYNKDGVLGNVHIVNFTSNQVTFSNEKGEYRIFAKPNDSIRFSSIGYKTIFEKLSSDDFNVYRKRTTLEKQVYELDEVSLNNNELSGFLSNDLKKTKPNSKFKLAKKASDFSNIEYTNNSTDHINASVKPIITRTDPTTAFEGFGTTTIIPFGQIRKIKKLRKELALKENLPAKLLNELGEDFFFIELKIPIDKYYHFLEYCNPLGIENLYSENEMLKIINILRKEHLSYLKLIEKH